MPTRTVPYSAFLLENAYIWPPRGLLAHSLGPSTRGGLDFCVSELAPEINFYCVTVKEFLHFSVDRVI